MFRWLIPAILLAQTITFQAGTGTVGGRILSADGKPMADIRVSAIEIPRDPLDTTPSTQVRIVRTGSDGHFLLDNIPSGRYYIAAGRIEFPTYYPGVTTMNLAEEVTVRAGTSIDTVNLVISGGSVSGRVAGLSPALPFPVWVELSASSDPSSLRAVATDISGSFEFPQMLPGEYALSVLSDTPGARVNSPLSVVIKNEDIRNLQIEAPVMVVGRVVVDDGRSLQFVTYTRSPISQDEATTIRILGISGLGIVRANGGFEINSATPGASYRIEVEGIPFSYYVKSIMAGSVDLTKHRLDMVGRSYPDVLITLTNTRPASEPAGVKVSGRITGRSKPLESGLPAIVILTSKPDRLAGNHSGAVPIHADGTFDVLDVPAGIYNVQVASPGFPTASAILDVGETDIKDFEIVVNSDVRN